jgi:MFS transporter, DHA3 family, macrolide efflux protein
MGAVSFCSIVFELWKDSSGPAFWRFWLGQALSVLGSEITTFALGFWFFQQTGQATPLFLTALAHFLPRISLGVLVGVIADRSNRKWLMLVSDLGQAVITAVMLALLLAGRLEPIIVYILIALKSVAGVFQETTEPLIVTALVPQHLMGKANGIVQAQFGSAGLLGPVLGGLLVITWGLPGVLAVDLVSFVFAALMTLTLRLKPVPSSESDPSQSDSGTSEKPKPRGLIADAKEGFHWLRNQPGLIGLMVTYAMFAFMLKFGSRLLTPLILSRTNQDAGALGLVAAAFGIGNLLGGALQGTFGYIKGLVPTVLVGMALSGLFEQVVMGFGRAPWVWAVANFCAGFVVPATEAANFELYQTRTPARLLGRVLAAKSLVARSLLPVALMSGGIFADRFFEPAMQGPLGLQLQPLFGEGPGRGYALMMVLFGVLTVLVSLSGFLRPALVNLEQESNSNQPKPSEAISEPAGAMPNPFATLEFVWEYQDPSSDGFNPQAEGATLPRES